MKTFKNDVLTFSILLIVCIILHSLTLPVLFVLLVEHIMSFYKGSANSYHKPFVDVYLHLVKTMYPSFHYNQLYIFPIVCKSIPMLTSVDVAWTTSFIVGEGGMADIGSEGSQ